MRDDAVFSMSKQIKPKFLPLSRNLWSIIITDSHNASEESSSLLKNPDTNTKLNYSSESKLCCSGHQLYLYLKWSPAVSMQNPMALNSTLHFSGDTSVLHSTRNLKRIFFFVFQSLYSFCEYKTCSFFKYWQQQTGWMCCIVHALCRLCVFYQVSFVSMPLFSFCRGDKATY